MFFTHVQSVILYSTVFYLLYSMESLSILKNHLMLKDIW